VCIILLLLLLFFFISPFLYHEISTFITVITNLQLYRYLQFEKKNYSQSFLPIQIRKPASNIQEITLLIMCSELELKM
jgi:predicted PurR-regulated permease PerM